MKTTIFATTLCLACLSGLAQCVMIGNKGMLDLAFADPKINDWIGTRAGNVRTILGLDTNTQDMEFALIWAVHPQSDTARRSPCALSIPVPILKASTAAPISSCSAVHFPSKES